MPKLLSLGVADKGRPRPSRRPGRGLAWPRDRSPGGAVSGRPHPSAGDAAGPGGKNNFSCPSGDPRGGGRIGSWFGGSGTLVAASAGMW